MDTTRRSLFAAVLAGVSAGKPMAAHSREQPQGLFTTGASQNRLGSDLMRSFERAAQLTAPHTAILTLTPADSTVTITGNRQLHILNGEARNLDRALGIINAVGFNIESLNPYTGIMGSFAMPRFLGENRLNSDIREGACSVFLTLSESFNHRTQIPQAENTNKDNLVRSLFSLQDPHYYNQIHVPGTYRDFVALMGYHEIDHCRPQGRFFEYQSDAFANMFYYHEHQRLGLNPEAPYFFRAARAYRRMLEIDNGFSPHRLNALTPLPGERWLTTAELQAADDQIKEIRRRVLTRALSDGGFLTDPVRKVSAYSSYANLGDGFPPYHVPESEMALVQSIVDSNDRRGAERWLRRNPPPIEVREFGNSSLFSNADSDLRITRSMRGAEHIYPQRLYQATVSLLRERAFDDLPHGKLFAERFVDGTRRYAPELFGVPARDRLGPPDLSAALRATPVFRAPDDPNQITPPTPQRRP